MANISVTNALNDNSATSDITKVGTNFTDLVNGLTDGTKDISVSAITAAGTITGNAFATIATAATGADIYSVVWTDYSGTSTIVGWSSYSTKTIYYKKVGKLVFVSFAISGTSDSTTTTFTLPYTSSNTVTTEVAINAVDNGGTAIAGSAHVPNSSTTVTLAKNYGGSAFTGSGTKSVQGQFFYEATS